VKVTGETVTLERASGENINVPIDRLSDDDREYLRRTSSATK
jgi:hypothetical protein